MANHPNRRSPNNRTINGYSRNAFPGDRVYIMLHAHRDVDGEMWPEGTEYTPLSGGVNNTTRGARDVREVLINGRNIRFAGARNAAVDGLR